MAGSDENNPGVIGPVNVQGGIRAGVGKFTAAPTGNNRRALGDLNRNVILPYPCGVNKRGLSERQGLCGKAAPIPVHRPITRKFAAQLANNNKQQQLPKPEEIKKAAQSIPIVSEESDDCTIIDAEDDKGDEDFSAPMFVQHTEAMLEEIDRMDEVEMEDVVEETIVDIDSCDKKNPLAVAEYIDDIYEFYRKAEISSSVSPDYMSQQFDINERMRGILIDWLIEVHYKFELMDETLYLTVNLIDRFLAVQQVVRKKLQLVGVTAMLLACKYEEVSVPVVEDLIVISDKAYKRKEIIDMEKLMVSILEFKISVPTPFVFMRRFLKAAQSDKKLELLSFFIIELCLVEYEMLKFPYSLLAAAAVYTAQSTLSGYRHWSETNQWYTNYSEEQILECSRLMVRFHQNAASGKLTGVHRKYSTSKFGFTARTQPPSFLLGATRF
ncbi:G2/mitotic-specific cyclin-2 [Mercurialis annua]|uniref:G2/mitotic-specific cyclin-2 n=1 Tax=Mercurialis annua TaxID=3986 RepID=UPI00215F2AEA|nr:G2/mitotic-specific cyclin-2 [Mercurialis annua]